MEYKTAYGSLCHCITAHIRLTLAKTARRRLRPPCGAFSGLAPPLPAYTGFIQMRAAKPTSMGVLYRFWLQNTAQMYTIPSWLDGIARTDIVPSWAHSTSRGLRPERGRAASTHRLQEKVRRS